MLESWSGWVVFAQRGESGHAAVRYFGRRFSNRCRDHAGALAPQAFFAVSPSTGKSRRIKLLLRAAGIGSPLVRRPGIPI
jgi:hypothetical protein